MLRMKRNPEPFSHLVIPVDDVIAIRRSGLDGGPDRLCPPGVIGVIDQQTARLLSFGGGSESSLPSRLELRTRDFLATQIDPLDLARVGKSVPDGFTFSVRGRRPFDLRRRRGHTPFEMF